MSQALEIEIFLQKLQQSIPLIDVRSPSEYKQGHIPSAINIPIFDDEERAMVGTRYKQVGKESAFLLGLDLVGTKLSDFVRNAKKFAPNGEVLVHCWRGGMRSGSFAILLRAAGMKVFTLKGGYKAYRNFVLRDFDKPLKINVLGGKTGSGKTEILKEIEKLGGQILDLEALAHHKGSSYGMIGQSPQPTSEMFENLLQLQLSKLDKSKAIWIEDESRGIGKCFIPQGLWEQMRGAKIYYIELDKALRINRLVNEYARFSVEELKAATDRILKKMGGQNHKKAMNSLENNDFPTACDLALSYYDKAYMFGLSKRDSSSIHTFEIKEDNPKKTAEKLIKFEDLRI